MTTKIFLHGFLGSEKDWQNLGIKPDSCINLWEIAKQINESDDGFRAFSSLLQKQLNEPVEIYAYSMGARLAIDFSFRHPDLVKKLSLFSVNPGLTTDEERSVRLEQDLAWSEKILSLNEDKVLELWQKQTSLIHDDKIKAFPYEKEILAKAMRIWSLAKQENFWPRLNELKCPAYFLAGEKDLKFTKIAQTIEATTKHPVVILADMGHRIPFNYDGPIGQWHWSNK